MCHQEPTFTDQRGRGATAGWGQAGVRLAATAQRRPATSPEIRLHWVPRSSEARYRITHSGKINSCGKGGNGYLLYLLG